MRDAEAPGPADSEAADRAAAPPSSPWAPLVFGVAVLAVGVLLLQQAAQVSGDTGPQGPRFMPFAVGIGWVVLAAAYLAGGAAGVVRRRIPDASERFDNAPQVVALLVLLVGYAYALEPVGYLLATSAFFTAAAAILGSRQHLRDAVVAVGLAVILYFLFSRSLGIYLPPGVLPL